MLKFVEKQRLMYLYLGLLPAKDSSGNERGHKQLPNGGPAIATCTYNNKYIYNSTISKPILDNS